MKTIYKGLAVALIHVLIVASLGAKLLYDRATRPRIWVRTGTVDPDMPIRGRYLTMSLEVHAVDFRHNRNGLNAPPDYGPAYVYLTVEDGKLVAHRTDRATGMFINGWPPTRNSEDDVFLLSSPVVFFIPEHAQTPRVMRGDELWAEVTVPRNGPPRPIQLALKHGDQWTPLTYR